LHFLDNVIICHFLATVAATQYEPTSTGTG
jgi:hypothetical protein